MQAILGRITGINRKSMGEGAIVTGNGHSAPLSGTLSSSLEVKFKAACVLPLRNRAPEWLKDQVLTLEREVVDPRELGEAGDSLVLTPAESDRWLSPLTVTPCVTSGELPQTLQIRLRWWKEEKLPEYTLRANGRSVSGQFTIEGDTGVATVDTGSLFSFRPKLPVAFEVTCDKLKAECTVLPADEPFARKLATSDGEKYRISSAWYEIGLTGQSQAGGIETFRERGRGIDHFRGPDNVISQPCEFAGHSDRVGTAGWGWLDKMVEASATCGGARREGGAVRLELEALVDEGQHLRTTALYTLYDHLPLLLLERSFQFHKGKGPDKEKEKDEKPKEPIDEMKPVQYGFRAAWMAEGRAGSGSRVLCMDGDHLVVNRPGQQSEFVRYSHWTMTGGWAMAEHPLRTECTLYLFDETCQPYLATWLGEHTLTLEPSWPHLPMRAEESIGFATAISVGEAWGAGPEGAWVACRRPRSEGGVECGLIARLRDVDSPANAGFVLGPEKSEQRLERALLPGVGLVFYATAAFPGGQMDQPFDAGVGRIKRRV
jgi:hypothetical protein